MAQESVRSAGNSWITPQDVGALLEQVEVGNVAGAMEVIRVLLDRGVSPDAIIADLFVPVQNLVGESWEVNDWSVAQEHAATAVVETVLSLVSARADTTGWRGRLVVACVEDERHSLPSRMLNERLRLRGWDTVFLGASTPADHLRSFLAGGDFLALVATSQIPLSFFGAGRTVRAAHAAGVPVVLGGRALGIDARRAEHLGADAWCADIDALDATLDAWLAKPPAVFAEGISDEAEHLVLLGSSGELVDAVMDRLRTVLPNLARHDDVLLRHTRSDARFIVEFLAAAVLTSDHRLMIEFLAWLSNVLGNRDVDPRVLTHALDVLHEGIPADLRRVRAIIDVIRPQPAV